MDMPNRPSRKSCLIGDITLSYVERHSDLRGRGKTLFLSHATGFHARVWDPVIACLPPVHSICVDLRGHGHSTGGPFDHWHVIAEDLAALLDMLDLRDIVGIGHSISGHALTQATSMRPDRVAALVLIDPVIMDPEFYETGARIMQAVGLHPAALRKRDFTGPDEMFARFRDRSPYALFTPEALHAYCDHALRPDGEGGLTLACAPETEAAAYMAAFSNPAIFDHVARVACPVCVLRSDPFDLQTMHDFTRSPTWPGLAATFPDGTDIQRPDLTHFMPMQAPDFVAAEIAHAAGLTA
ncbi:alpha/beta fold hydrolase [Ruegeria marina]|uniref:Pimeloyl-ACP methyl ester carboxylesterase n=1 Tax=Ruegeria marina TaxID=639004 RepID=A0A1G7BVU0_9RHOB|nr:alpha/beta hydrolase [Ruegeria marina]SDE31218.1 Pimeloyl-ACP methyl ester carboxylesterase [Ruegeria marina]